MRTTPKDVQGIQDWSGMERVSAQAVHLMELLAVASGRRLDTADMFDEGKPTPEKAVHFLLELFDLETVTFSPEDIGQARRKARRVKQLLTLDPFWEALRFIYRAVTTTDDEEGRRYLGQALQCAALDVPGTPSRDFLPVALQLQKEERAERRHELLCDVACEDYPM